MSDEHEHQFPEERTPEGVRLLFPCLLCGLSAGDGMELLKVEHAIALAELGRLDALINNPHTAEFLDAVRLEAAHQRERWPAEGDAGKSDADWFWLIGYLAGKALNKPEKQLHHIVTTAAACLNWHAHKTGAATAMRPGIEVPRE